MFEQIKVDMDGGIAVVRMNRPDRMNALTRVLERELREAMEALAKDKDVRVILLTGEGRAFCAGMDMQELETLPPEDIRDASLTTSFDMNRRADYQGRYNYFPAIPKPVISVVNGAAAGLGLIFALYSDFRFAGEKAVFSTAFSRRGLVAEHGVAWILSRVAGHAAALDLLLSARKIDAQEALAMGLVNRVVADDALMDSAMAYARDLADNVSPRSIRVMKEQIWETPYQSLAQAVAMANREMEMSLRSEDFREGVRHFVERRAPNFSGA